MTLLEEAVASSSKDANLWDLLGRSYFMKLSTQPRAGTGPAELASTLQRAIGAFERALDLNPNDVGALSGHGMALTILGAFQQNQDSRMRGIQEMNRAVEIQPESIHARLARGFTTVNLPAPIRNTPAAIEDLSFIIKAAKGHNQRAVDSLHIILGDVYAETAQTPRARAEYEAAATLSSTTREQAQLRLAALEQGSVPPADIARFRSGLGTRCTMCHAQ